MKTVLYIIFLLFAVAQSPAQEKEPGRKFYIPIQYAGSIGLFSVGGGATFAHEKLDVGLMYGFLPKSSGGPVHTATIKLAYSPFHLRLNPGFSATPITAGAFFAQHFNNFLSTSWDAKYPKGYYWWPRNFRQHIFLRTAIAIHPGMERIDKFNLYLEMNTNDLYLYSYLPNTQGIRLYDILFFGLGMQIFLR
jgi:hypothetical protein